GILFPISHVAKDLFLVSQESKISCLSGSDCLSQLPVGIRLFVSAAHLEYDLQKHMNRWR
ncbi:hypothetical protein Tco_1415437, partial [Tanacetum coccineum]